MLGSAARRLATLCFGFTACIGPRKPHVTTAPPFLTTLRLNTLSNLPGAEREAKRVGRGPGSGLGKFSGRGMKGHRSRAGGGVSPRFQGGQTPLQKRLPKYGMQRNWARLDELNLGKIAYFIKRGVLDPAQTITIPLLFSKGVIGKCQHGLKVLSKGAQTLKHKVQLQVTNASAGAIEAVRRLGGDIVCVYQTPRQLKELQNPEKYPFEKIQPLATKKAVILMERIKKKGVEVRYNKPRWVLQLEEQRKPILRQPRRVAQTGVHRRRAKVYRKAKITLVN